jgi:hypothetical protein
MKFAGNQRCARNRTLDEFCQVRMRISLDEPWLEPIIGPLSPPDGIDGEHSPGLYAFRRDQHLRNFKLEIRHVRLYVGRSTPKYAAHQ